MLFSGIFILPDHMDKSWMNIVHRTKDPRYELGVNEFLNFSYRDREVLSKVPCPCKNCNNFRHHNRTTIFSHLMKMGIVVIYVRWIYHGESYDTSDDDISIDEVDGASDDLNDDDLDEMLNNIGQSKWGDN